MAKGTKMNIEVRNIILDLKRLRKTSGQISQTLSEVHGYSVTRFGVYKFIRRTYSGCKDRKPRGRKFTDGHRTGHSVQFCTIFNSRRVPPLFCRSTTIRCKVCTCFSSTFLSPSYISVYNYLNCIQKQANTTETRCQIRDRSRSEQMH